MSKNSKIEWTDHTWNPWRYGCTKRGPECLHCYAETWAKRTGEDWTVITRSKTTFNDPLKFPAGKVFICSLSDFWLESADCWRDEAWSIMRQAPQHTYIIPTKRPENISDRLPGDWGAGWPNVWLLISAGTQRSLEKWWPVLARVPATVRGISAEPLLEPVDFSHCQGLDWLVLGGESGTRARACNLDWLRDGVAQCNRRGIPTFVKQLGAKPIENGRLLKLRDRKGGDWGEWPPDLRIRECPEHLEREGGEP